MNDVIDYLIAVIYPNYIATVATPADLPVSGNPNDYYFVTDDGDGKSAGYVWSVIDNAGQWIKRYDVDWSLEGILAETVNRTLYMYVHKYGLTDKDASGANIVGLYAGQTIFGGDATNQNLTFNANSADTTGYVQTDNHFRPTANNAIDLGTGALKFRTLYLGTSALITTLTLSSGLITDSTGAISFDNENLSTTGSVAANTAAITTQATIGNLTLSNGSITSGSGALTFGSANLSTTGTLSSGVHTIGTLVLSSGSITDTSGAISFDNENLSTTGTFAAGNATFTRVDSDNIRIDGNTISVLNLNGNLIVSANGTGIIDLQSPLTTLGQTVTGTLSVTGQFNIDNLRLDGNVISSTNSNGNITLTPNGSGLVESSSGFFPTTSTTQDLGKSGNLWQKLWLSGSIGGATQILVSELMTLRNVLFRDAARTQAVQSGDTLFYDTVSSTWLASHPDTEITHSELSGLTTGDAGHTQFALLAGRSGGQTLQGDTASGGHLVLESTANASKGFVKTKDSLVPFTTAAFSGGWSGTDLGGASNYFNDIYSKGVHKGFRFENYTSSTLPAASAQNPGRTVWATDNSSYYTDTGGTWVQKGVGTAVKYQTDTSWNGTDVTKDVTVSAGITDARTAVWQLCDNTNDYERIFCSLKPISASVVRITVGIALPSGSYRLIGVE